jgi:ketosteroid isomerase-like protein
VSIQVPDVINSYFEADARRDTDAIVALFTDDWGGVIDEGETWRGSREIRAWREGTAARYQYTTEVFDTESTTEDVYLLTGRLEGNLPGGTADVTWRFTLDGGRISQLRIA